MDDALSKKIKEISVEILKDFDGFCKEHHLEYWLSYGTLLGAVRHQGFIPWDDDIDVDMPIEDYRRMEKLWQKCGDKERYFLQTKANDPKLPNVFNRLRLNNTATIDAGYEKYPIHWGIPLDIFPVYHMPKNKVFQLLQRKCFSAANVFARFDWTHPEANSIVCWVFQRLSLFALWCVELISKCSQNSSFMYYAHGYSGKTTGDRAMWAPGKPIGFEDVELQGYADAHAYLKWQYGDDYMVPPPEDQRAGHGAEIIDLEHDGAYYTNCLRRNK